MQVNQSEVADPDKPLSFGDFVEVVPNEAPTHQYPGYHLTPSGGHMLTKPQHGKQRPPVEQQRWHLNTTYSLKDNGQHSPTDIWRVSSTELTTPPQRKAAEGRRAVPSA